MVNRMITRYFKLSSIVFVFLFCIPSLTSIDFFNDVYAHPVVIDSSPKQFQSLEESPDKVIVFFSEAIVLQYSQISVIDSQGTRVDDGKPENYDDDLSTIATNINEDLPKGTYTINTKVLSAVDGHVVDNSVVFSVGETISGLGELPTTATSKSIFEIISFDNSLSRVPGYVGQILIIGAPLIFLWIQKPLSQFDHIRIQMNNVFVGARKNLVKLIIIADSLVIFSVVIMVVLQASSIGGNVIDVFSTEFGEILIIRLIISIILLIATLIFYNKFNKSQYYSVNNNKGLLLIISLGLAILFTNSLISHAAALKDTLPIFLDYFHGIAASIWIGSLVFLAFIFIPRILQIKENELKSRIISIIIPRFSILILPILGSIVLTGPTLLWSIENNLFTTFSSLYGKILILKLTLAMIMVAMGAYHEFVTHSKLSKSIIKKVREGSAEIITTTATNLSSQTRRFHILLRIESIIGIALLFVVSLMTNMVLPSGEFPTLDNDNSDNLSLSQEINLLTSNNNQANATLENNNEYLTDIYSNNQKVQVELEPVSIGQNTMTVSFTDLNNSSSKSNSNSISQKNVNIENTTLKLNQIEKKIGPIQLEMEEIDDGVFSATIPISTLGTWNFEIQGKTLQPNTPNTIATFNIDIKPQLSDLEFNITEYPTPTNQSLLLYPVYHKPTNSIWVGDNNPESGRIFQFDITDKSYKIHKIEDTNLITLSVFDPIESNILWYVDPTKSMIGQYDVTANKSRGQYELSEMGIISGLTIDDQQNLWMSLVQANSIIKFDSKTNNFTTYDIPTDNSRPLGLIFDKKNNFIWFAESIGKLGKIDLNTGNITEYPTTSNNNSTNSNLEQAETEASDFSLFEPTSLLLDSKTSNIYISEHDSNSIVLFNPFIESFKRYNLPDDYDGLAFGMVFDIYGNIWIAQHTSDDLAILDPDSGKITKVNIPNQGSFIQYLTTDSQGDIWFAEQRGNALGKTTIKFIPSSNVQPSIIDKQAANNNNNNNNNTIAGQNNGTITTTTNTILEDINLVIKKLDFYEIIGPLLVVAVIASTLLYIDSHKKLHLLLIDLDFYQRNINKDQTKNKKPG